jgi:hypothetical protein
MFLVPEAPTSAAADTSKSAIKPGADSISFLCPNGHKLSGPRALQGKAGQCPHCGSKFRIPNYDEPEQSPSKSRFKTEEDDIPLGEIVEGSADDDVEEVQDVDVLDDDEVVEDVELDESDLTPPPPPPPDNIHPLALLCLRFWRAGNGKIEIVYGENQTLTAEHFSPELSQWDCGVFAHRGDTGAYSVTAIPWNSIRRLSFPGIEKLPEVFE